MFTRYNKPITSLINLFDELENTYSKTSYPNFIKGNFNIDVPGFNNSNLNIEFEDGILFIKGETEIEGEKRNINKQFGTFKEEPEISLRDGVLIIKSQIKESERKKIEIK